MPFRTINPSPFIQNPFPYPSSQPNIFEIRKNIIISQNRASNYCTGTESKREAHLNNAHREQPQVIYDVPSPYSASLLAISFTFLRRKGTYITQRREPIHHTLHVPLLFTGTQTSLLWSGSVQSSLLKKPCRQRGEGFAMGSSLLYSTCMLRKWADFHIFITQTLCLSSSCGSAWNSPPGCRCLSCPSQSCLTRNGTERAGEEDDDNRRQQNRNLCGVGHVKIGSNQIPVSWFFRFSKFWYR